MNVEEFETTMDGGEGGGGEAAAPEATAGEPAGFDAEQSFSQLASQVSELGQALEYLTQQSQYQASQPQYQSGPVQPQYEEFDPYDPEGFRQGVSSIFRSEIAPLYDALSPLIQAHQNQESEAYMGSQMENLNVSADPIGETDFSPRDLVALIAGGYSYAHPGIAPEVALRAAYDVVGPVLAEAAKNGRTGQVEELEELRTANQPLTGQGDGGSVEAQPRARTMQESAQRAAAKLGILP